MDKTKEYQQKEEEEVLEIWRKRVKQQWKQSDEDEKSPSINDNASVETSVELENAFQKLINRKKELENGDYKSYDEVKMVVEKQSEMNVYYDKEKEEGIWKCRNCTWTYESGSPLNEHIEHPKWYLHMLIYPKTGNRKEPCVYCEIEGLKSICGFSATENNGVSLKYMDDGSIFTVKNFEGENALINGEPLKDNARKKYLSEITQVRDDVEIKESGEKSTELDVEKVLEEQDTHDLYCPNCNSCITKKVILRKRKCKIHISSEDAKRNKKESVDNSLDENLTHFSDDNTRESEAKVFRCLSCFSFFIPSGSGFHLFKVFGDKSDEQARRPAPPTKKTWLSSILASHKEGSESKRDARDDIATESKEEVEPEPQAFVAQVSVNGACVGLEGNHLELDTCYQIVSSAFANETSPMYENGYSITQLSGKTSTHTKEDAIHETQEEGLKIHGQSSKESPTLGNSHLNEKLNGIISMENADTNYSSGASLFATVEIKANTYFEEPIKAVRDNLNISINDPGMLLEVTKRSNQTPAKVVPGSDMFITVEESIEPTATQEPQGLTSVETWPLPYSERVQYENFQGIEIVKSIVYGGLAEFIASLCIVSSAVGADTATLKILALGLANLIGGLFIIGQNLWDLKNDNHSNPTDQLTVTNSIPLATQQDRYQELLGQRENFWVHATIALLSYLILGMLPPIIYAFSFREDDNKDYKLITVAAASLVCILLLSMGKAYIQRPPKAYSKTISYYVVMVFMTSGVSYAFGDLFKQLLENLGWSGSGLDLGLPVLEMPTPILPLASF